jgi:hypothetical protein
MALTTLLKRGGEGEQTGSGEVAEQYGAKLRVSEKPSSLGVVDDGCDFASMANDRRVIEEALNVLLVKGGDARRVKVGKGLVQGRRFVEDHEPAEARLKELPRRGENSDERASGPSSSSGNEAQSFQYAQRNGEKEREREN